VARFFFVLGQCAPNEQLPLLGPCHSLPRNPLLCHARGRPECHISRRKPTRTPCHSAHIIRGYCWQHGLNLCDRHPWIHRPFEYQRPTKKRDRRPTGRTVAGPSPDRRPTGRTVVPRAGPSSHGPGKIPQMARSTGHVTRFVSHGTGPSRWAGPALHGRHETAVLGGAVTRYRHKKKTPPP